MASGQCQWTVNPPPPASKGSTPSLTTIFYNTAGSSEGEITSTMKRVAVAPGYSYGPADMANRSLPLTSIQIPGDSAGAGLVQDKN